MSRASTSVGLALLTAGLLQAGCGQQATSQDAEIEGTHDLVQVGDLLFITSTDRSELRVLDLVPREGNTLRTFVRAPNPLQPLAITVLDRPIALARDIHYEPVLLEDGTSIANAREVGGPYVYAISSGTAAISIVGADRSQLVERVRLPTPGPVTAVAGRGPETAGAASRLFFATFETSVDPLGVATSSGQVRFSDLPAPDALDAEAIPQLQAGFRVVGTYPGESVVALLPLPGNRVVIALRSQSGVSGRTLLVDTETLATQTLEFPFPVRQLATHASASGIGAGDRIFGILDEESCGGSVACTGLVAVDANTRQVALNAAGAPMATIRFGRTLPRGLSLATLGQVSLPGTGVVEVSVLGAVTTSDGRITFFHAGALQHFDLDPNPAAGTSIIYRQAPTPENPLGPSLPYQEGPVPDTLKLADGAAVDEQISIIYEGRLPGLTDQPTSDSDLNRFPVPAPVLARAEIGDLIEVTAAGAICAELNVDAKDPGALVVSAVPPGCAGRSSFSVRARGLKPYVVTGAVSGYLGRTGPGDQFRSENTVYFHHPPGFDPAVPMLQFTFGAGTPTPQRDWRYVLDVEDAFTPFSSTVDASSVRCAVHLPGGVAQDPVRHEVYLAYPSANGIVVISTPSVAPGALTRNAVCYR